VANKLNLNNLILLNNNKQKISLSDLKKDTYEFFEKLPGYETLRMLLCSKAILVEGPSDELVIQRAYMDKHSSALPIEKEIDVISVGLTFKRFLEIADIIKKPVAVVTDNDGDYGSKIEKKYKDYDDSDTIKIFADDREALNTLEPQLVDANKDNLKLLCEILELDDEEYDAEQMISDYMVANKTECALKIFNSEKSIRYPEYINDVMEWCDEK
jgi:putative ATP-dependent endonuclease of OLD family